MLFERIESEGLAHYSYIAGDGGEAVVIDPRRDVDVYLQKTAAQGLRITSILETHRHEDFVVGSPELAARCGAPIRHSTEGGETFGYGQPIRDRETVQAGRLRLEALYTPGHTPGHMSYLLHDPNGVPWIVFTGDALFAGEVGRVDLAGPERLQEMAGLLYDSLFRRILPLGDGTIVCPAHGAGSACGPHIGERPWTTVGLERRYNPRLQYTSRADFVAQVARAPEFPPYFQTMERLNQEGPPLLGPLPSLMPLSPHDLAARAPEAQVLDTRLPAAFGAAHVPGAFSIWQEGMPRFAGWYLSYDRPILLVGETDDVSQTVRELIRLGYDHLEGYLAGGMLAWHKAGLASERIDTATVQELCRRLDRREDTWVLDVRSLQELDEEGRIPGAYHIHITQLPGHMGEVPRDRPVYVFCGSGLRSMIGASLLRRAGWQDLTVVLGGFAGWSSAHYPIEKGASEAVRIGD